MMKKLLAAAMVLVLCLSLFAACGTTAAPAAEPETPAAETKEPEAAKPEEPVQETQETTGGVQLAEAFPEVMMPGDTFADFTVELCDGTPVTLSELLATHKVVMINIWATWCSPCREEFPAMNEAYEAYKDDVAILCLSPFDDNSAIAEFKAENNLTLPMGSDTVGLGDLLVQVGYPTTVLIDRFGTYVYNSVGGLTQPEQFSEKWDVLLGDDYTESIVIEDEPSVRPEIENASDEDLTAALCPTGELTFSCLADNEYAWTFLPDEKGVVNSNSNTENSFAAITTTVQPDSEHCAITIHYETDLNTLNDYVTFYVNDVPVKAIGFATEGDFIYTFTDDGPQEIVIVAEHYSPADSGDYSGKVILSNAHLLTAEQAEQLLAAQPQYPTLAEPEAFQIECLSENAKRILVECPDPDNAVLRELSEIDMYIIDSTSAAFRFLLGSAIDPDNAVGFGDYEAEYHILSQLETDETGFLMETTLSSVEDGGYCNTYITLVPNANDSENYTMLFIFVNEENVNYFLANDLTDYDGNPIEGVYWKYADGTLPSTDAIAEEPMDYTYSIVLQDENGDPVENVMLNICTDTMCTPVLAENGFYGFNDDPYPYIIHVLSIPEGYELDLTLEYTMDADGGILVIEIPHAKG